jgi:hypothetical protein
MAGKLQHFREVTFDRRGYRRRGTGIVVLVSGKTQICVDALNFFSILVMLIIAELVLYIKQYVKAAQSAYCKTENIDKAESLVLQQKAKSGFKVTFNHSTVFLLYNLQYEP